MVRWLTRWRVSRGGLDSGAYSLPARSSAERMRSMPQITFANLAQFVGKELGVSGWLTVDQSRINQFAECSGDRQWIHVDVERAKRESPYRSPIAHGYLTLAMVAPLAMEIGIIPKDAAAGLNYGVDKVCFLAPVPAGARVRLRVTLSGI